MQHRLPLRSLAAAVFVASPILANQDPVADALNVSEYDLVELDVPTQPGMDVAIDISIEGQPFQLDLERHNLRADDFSVLVQVDGGGYESHEAELPMTYRGDAEGIENSLVAGSLLNGQVRAVLRTDFGTWGIQPLSDFDESAAPNVHVVHEQGDFIDQGWTCGFGGGIGGVVPSQPGGSTFGTGLALTEIAFDTDFEYFQDLGSVNACINDIENITNIMTGIYENDVDVTFEITTIIVRSTSNDPYSNTNDAGNLLNQFDNHWSSQQSFIRRDVAHIMSGRNMAGGVLGVAFLGGVCSSGIGYGLSWSTFTGNLTSRVGLTAHEVGHNYGSGHCDGQSGACRIMCSGLGGCNNNLSSFGAFARNAISNFANNVNCNPILAPALTLPFEELFNGPGIPRENWPVRQSLSLSSAGIGEPSGDSSLNMNAAGAQPFADDFIRSNVILMGSASDQQLSFFTQHRGVENGERLFLEYLNAQDNWIFLYEVVSDGVDQTTFIEHTVQLPMAAYHDGFRFRMTTDVDQTNDNWYIDDVRIDDGFPCGGPTNYCATSPNSFSPFGAFIAASGSISVSANDLDLLAFDAAANQVGIFYYGPDQIQAPFGNGFRCVGGQTTRLPIISTDAFGLANFDLDLTNLPPGSTVTPGDTINYQFWFRDPNGGGAAFNLTDAMTITWCP